MRPYENRALLCRPIYSAIIALTLSLSLSGPGLASSHQSYKSDPYKAFRNYDGALVNRPVYDPISKSYFELVETKGGLSYERAMRFARTKTFRNVRGRLAIIRSGETQKFLDRIFRPDGEAWFGLRLYCPGRVLFWTDGKTLKRGKDYVNWGPKWHYARNYLPCKPGAKYAGVTLSPADKAGYVGKGLRWFAIAPRHAVAYSIIEYPTGGQ